MAITLLELPVHEKHQLVAKVTNLSALSRRGQPCPEGSPWPFHFIQINGFKRFRAALQEVSVDIFRT